MSNNQIVIDPSTSSIQVTVEFPISSEHENLVTKYRAYLKLTEQPLELNTLFKAKLVALLTTEDPMLSPINKDLQNKVDKTNANSHYLNQFIKDLHESGKLLYIDEKLVIPFTLGNAIMKTLPKLSQKIFGIFVLPFNQKKIAHPSKYTSVENLMRSENNWPLIILPMKFKTKGNPS